MASEQVELTQEDVLDILANLINEIRGTGLRVGARNAPATATRADGVLIFVEGVSLDGEVFVLKK